MKQRKRNLFAGVFLPDGKLREAMELYPGKTRTEVQGIIWKELRKKLLVAGLLLVFFLGMAVYFAGKEPDNEGILRPRPGKSAIQEEVLLETRDNDWKKVPVEVGAREYSELQVEMLHQQAEQYLDTVALGENKSWESIKTHLYFPDVLPDNTATIYWSTDAPWLITRKGEVKNADLESEEQVRITAKLSYGTEYRMFSKVVTVYPKEYNGEEALLRRIQLELRQQEQASRTTESFILPETVLGYTVKKTGEENGQTAAFFILLALVVPLLLYYGYFGGLDTKRKKRREQAESGYLSFVTKLSLMMAAGITVRQAFNRLADEYEKNYGKKHMLTAELKVTKQELDNGHSEQEAYEAFGRRIGVLAYRRLASLLTQNVSRGVQGMQNLLLLEAKEVMAQERAGIKVRGEQAGTKLLVPMMGLLFLVFAILLVPAFQNF